MVKLAFVFGPLLIFFPMLLRSINATDNSSAFTFIAIGIVVVILAEQNRSKVEELSPYY